MSTLGAMLLVIMVIGMLFSYHIGHAVGRREGWAQGRNEGKREGAVRAYAVGYDRGRHDRHAKEADSSGTPATSPLIARGCMFWFLPILVVLLAIILAAVSGSLKIAP